MVSPTAKYDRRRRRMPRGDKGAYTDKQKRQAEHIEESYEERGTSAKEAARRAWATVNKESGGGKKSGSGRGKKTTKSAAKKGGKKAAKKSSKKSGSKKR
jgi:plasmid stabilization system protein ParE